jgi:hypothetical protein
MTKAIITKAEKRPRKDLMKMYVVLGTEAQLD